MFPVHKKDDGFSRQTGISHDGGQQADVTAVSSAIARMMMRILYYIVYGIWYLFSLLPMKVLYVLSDFLYLVVYHVARYRRKLVEKNISASFPDKAAEGKRRISKEFYHWFCDNFIETVKLMTISREELMRRMQFTGMGKMEEILQSGQSVAIYLAHYGQWDWITSIPLWIRADAQCCDIYHPLENKYFDQLFRVVRERYSALCIPMAQTLRQIVRFRQQGRTVVIGYIADQGPFWNNIHHWLAFLHHDTPVLTGAERIIKSANQAVFYGDVVRIKRGYYRCDLKYLTDEPGKFKDYELTDLYFQEVEETILRDPALYLWSHNRWKRTREEFDIRYNKETGRVDLRDLEIIKKEKGWR